MLFVAYRRDEPQAKIRKPNRAERIEALSEHLLEKWRRQDYDKAYNNIVLNKKASAATEA